MKVLYITTSLETGGAQVMLYKMLATIDRHKIEPVVISLIDRGSVGDQIEAMGIPVHCLHMRKIPTLRMIWALRKLVQKIQPDVVQGWMYHGNLAAQWVSRFTRSPRPVVWSIHYSIDALDKDKKTTVAVIKLGAKLSRFADRVLFVSQVSQSQHHMIGYAKTNSQVIPNGFDPTQFLPSDGDCERVRKELGISSNSILIGIAGRYHPMKDHLNFLRAATYLLSQLPNSQLPNSQLPNSQLPNSQLPNSQAPSVYFIMMGAGLTLDNPELTPFCSALGDRLRCLGERRDMSKLLASLDIYTSSSAYGEAFPMVIGEAMSCGVPCVVTDVGDSGLMVDTTGSTVPARQPEALAMAWLKLLNLSAVDRRALGHQARNRVIQEFSLEVIVPRYEALYESLSLSQKQSQTETLNTLGVF